MRRWLYWLGVLCAAALLAGGGVVAIRGYSRTAGLDGVVRGYFAALARSDAADALAFGDIPDGPHTLLTATVLREQQRIAPLRGLSIVAVRRNGDAAQVDVSYTLAFHNRAVLVTGTVALHRRSGGWRLDEVAIRTELVPGIASERESIVGAGIPAGPTLLFPGAVPVLLDTPYLQLDPSDHVDFGALSQSDVDVEVSAAGRRAAIAAIRTKLLGCLAEAADPACPLPGARYVPGSVQGRLSGDLHDVSVDLAPDPAGLLHIHARATVTGAYARLDFDNQRVAGHGRIDLDVDAAGYAVAPLAVRWTQP